MPSWNIHNAHVEHLLAVHRPQDLGIADPNAFLFGNYVPDIYVGYMVPDVSYHIDYCITHVAGISRIPVSDADSFWDHYVAHRFPAGASGQSLVLGAWAHLVADRFYNGRYREFYATHTMPEGDEVRIRKQADFDLFGHYLGISTMVEETPELQQACWDFVPYRLFGQDVRRSIDVANGIVRESAQPPATAEYLLLDDAWLSRVFAECDERLATWLLAWRELAAAGKPCRPADIRKHAGLAPATPDTDDWMR